MATHDPAKGTLGADGVVVIDGDGRIRILDPGAAAMFGCHADDVVGQPITTLMPESFRAPHRASFARHLATGEATILGREVEVRGLRADGREFALGLRVTRATLSDSVVFVGIVRDLDAYRDLERDVRTAEEALRRSLSLQQATLEATDEGILVVDLAGEVESVNRRFLEMWRLDPTGLVEWDDLLRLPSILGQIEDESAYVRILESLRAEPEARHTGGLSLRDGRVFELRSTPRRFDGKSVGRVFGFRDVTDRVRAEAELARSQEQLVQIQKMDAVGRLAGGIAHDFNNLLTVVISYAQLVRSGRRTGARAEEALDEILKASDRAAELTRQLLAFGRKQFLDLRVLDLNTLVADMQRMLTRIVGEDVELHVALAPDLARVRADKSQLDQVLMNLAVNARDAMPSGGRLMLETANVLLTEEFLEGNPGMTPGPFVSLAVTDTGIGMTDEIRTRVFEPFFTTKEVGRGTGLGLATVYGIVRQSGGMVTVYSEPGFGSTFRVYLPAIDAPAEEHARSSLVPVVGGSETILLVEDATQVRDLTTTVLEGLGYRVVARHDPLDALELLDDPDVAFDLVVTDIVMPRLNGPQMFERMRALRPALKVLFVSGYTEAAVVHNRVLDSDAPFLAKPFTPESLARAVRRVLDGTDGAAARG